MLMVRSKAHGAVVFGPNGTRYLDEDRVEGEDPTTLFGPHTIMSLKREDEMVHAPDLLLLSQYDPELGEVAAFEELIGSHGGLGGPQTEPFILHPAEWTLDEEVPLGAPAIYRNIRRWLSVDRHRARPAGSQPVAAPVARRGAPRPGPDSGRVIDRTAGAHPWVKRSARSLPFAVGVAISPVPIIAVILMLVTRHARVNGPAFVIGWLIGLTIIGVLVIGIAGRRASSGGEPATWLPRPRTDPRRAPAPRRAATVPEPAEGR